jgi:hypothetical protein
MRFFPLEKTFGSFDRIPAGDLDECNRPRNWLQPSIGQSQPGMKPSKEVFLGYLVA